MSGQARIAFSGQIQVLLHIDAEVLLTHTHRSLSNLAFTICTYVFPTINPFEYLESIAIKVYLHCAADTNTSL